MKDPVEVSVEATGKSVEPPEEVTTPSSEVPVEAPTKPVEEGKPVRASARKVAANRQNALKSTGPKTPKGKANSRRNALKHGLFAMDLPHGTLTRTEDPAEYQALLGELRQQYEPVGIAEDLEVQRICACWWRLRRPWRFEIAEVLSSRLDIFYVESEAFGKNLACAKQLRIAQAQIKADGDISDELAEKIFSGKYVNELWDRAEETVRAQSGKGAAGSPPPATSESTQELNSDELLRVTELVICELESPPDGVLDLDYDLRALPKTEVLDRVLRADAAAERSLNHAIERLERVQRRRTGEPVPPPVSVRLTR